MFKRILHIAMIVAFLTSLASMVMSMINSQHLLAMWQMTTAIWIGVAYLNQSVIDKLQKQIWQSEKSFVYQSINSKRPYISKVNNY